MNKVIMLLAFLIIITIPLYAYDMVYIEEGTLKRPHHSITLSSFYIGKYEVTQKEWKRVMKNTPSHFKGDNLPVEKITWYEILEFCNKLSKKEGYDPVYTINKNKVDTMNNNKFDHVKWVITVDWSANGYRLPTEAEWEFAALGGIYSKNFIYSGGNDVHDVGWNSYNSEGTTHPVGVKKPNELGIYDMSGNVYEWCWDWYNEYYYDNCPARDPRGPEIGEDRVLRGGCWHGYNNRCKIFTRSYTSPVGSYYIGYGFRMVRNSDR